MQRDERNINKLLDSTLNINSNCIDVGAHKGDFLRWIIQNASGGQHFAFEPIPRLAEKLMNDFPNVRIQGCALSDTDGLASFYVIPEMLAWSGLKTQAYPVDVNPIKIEIETRLDNLIPESINIDFIKIDVEGAEYSVLLGGIKTIKRSRPIILYEHAHIHSFEYKVYPKQLFDLLTIDCKMNIFSLDGKNPLSREVYLEIYESSFCSNYNRNAQTNFVARPI